jgi:hypothetical protein
VTAMSDLRMGMVTVMSDLWAKVTNQPARDMTVSDGCK